MSSAQKTPLISVVIPTYHRNDLLELCLRNLAPGTQTLESARYEVIVSDDGARESAERLVNSQFPWAQWRQGPRRGPAANRNNGAKVARGEWLAFVDDDCIPERNWLAAFHEGLVPSIDVYEGRTVTNQPWLGPFYTAPVNHDGGKLWSCNMMIRTTRFWDLDGFDAAFPFPHMEDVDFRVRLEKSKVEYRFNPLAVVLHPQRPIQKAKAQARSYESYFYFARKHGISVKEAGLSAIDFVRYRYNVIRSSRSPITVARFGFRALAELCYLAFLIPGWRRKYPATPAQNLRR